jgi:4-diphosphocytidyl-2-C-methyl-D-erythritol kinase
MKLRAPAKVNLQLRILGRRADGFHDIETIVVPVSLSDEITVETFEGDAVTISCDDSGVPVDRKNLAAAAAHEFQEETGLLFAARIDIRKSVPIGAGLGGGSSDAAAVLLALDELLGTQLGVGGLERVAARLGSDVPFFVRRRPAICRGRGELIEPFDIPESLKILLIKPPFGVETAWAYKAWEASRSLTEGREAAQDLGWIKIFNSLERPVFEKFLVLPVMKD